MNNLLGSLGLSDVSADPNDIPDGSYDGDVFRSEFVCVESKDTLAHVITYRVTEGEAKGAQRQQWYTLYNKPRDANGNFTSNPNEVVSVETDANGKPNVLLTEGQKRWYKKLWADLLFGTSEGLTPQQEQQIDQSKPEDLVGKTVTFGVKTRNGFKNISFVNPRVVDGATGVVPQGGAQSITPF
jgi:hypothetical protein